LIDFSVKLNIFYCKRILFCQITRRRHRGRERQVASSGTELRQVERVFCFGFILGNKCVIGEEVEGDSVNKETGTVNSHVSQDALADSPDKSSDFDNMLPPEDRRWSTEQASEHDEEDYGGT
jgi:hypothetical protein